MRIIILQDDLHEYLVHVVRSYAAKGVGLDECLSLHYLGKAVLGAQQLDEKQVAKLMVQPSGDANLSVGPSGGEKPEGEPEGKGCEGLPINSLK